jgi:arylsulfatase A
MHRREFLKAFCAGAAWTAGSRGAMGAKAAPPNVVIVLVDDMGWTDVACYGSKYYDTPNVDRLCREGMKFTQGYAACAVCSPTRASIMTGRYPARVGVTDWIHFHDPRARVAAKACKNPEGYDPPRGRKLLTPVCKFWLEHDEVTIAEMLKPLGYVSAHVGKWHLGPKGWFPTDQGFDFNYGGCEIGAPPSYFDPYARGGRGGIATMPPRKKGEYLTDREADHAVAFIENHAKKHHDRPFFLYLAHYAVHSPIQAKKDMIAKYKARKPTNQKNPVYAAMVESVDQAVGRVMDVLDKHKLTDNTLLVFTSDNGGAVHFPATDNAPLRKGKGYPYEGGIREPFLFRWPGVVKPGSVSNVPICSIDLLPTIAAATGAKLPGRVLDGVDLTPLLRGTGGLKRKTLYWHFPHYWWGTRIKPYSIIRDGDWKLIRNYEDARLELFDLAADLGEKTDLAAKMPKKAAELNAKLTAWLKDVGAKLPKPNPQAAR